MKLHNLAIQLTLSPVKYTAKYLPNSTKISIILRLLSIKNETRDWKFINWYNAIIKIWLFINFIW